MSRLFKICYVVVSASILSDAKAHFFHNNRIDRSGRTVPAGSGSLVPARSLAPRAAPAGSGHGGQVRSLWQIFTNTCHRFLDILEQFVKRNLSVAMAELDRFSRRNEFRGQQLSWVRSLAGGTVQGFCYPNCQAFWDDTDAKLEANHDYIQVFFPSLGPSQYANQDLYIRDNVETWKALRLECPTLWENIRINMVISTLRMLHFWGLRIAFPENVERFMHNLTVENFGDFDFPHAITIIDNPNSVLHRAGDHNRLRLTRVIMALQLFGCEDYNDKIREYLEANYPRDESFNFWMRALGRDFQL
ncbi:MAG: hypothetical protein LBF34_02765 [Puniceicoccales bacterium]|jgi:hypothetical protein|nr:hypothetical protein [Puniceicoccales bacterium]